MLTNLSALGLIVKFGTLSEPGFSVGDVSLRASRRPPFSSSPLVEHILSTSYFLQRACTESPLH